MVYAYNYFKAKVETTYIFEQKSKPEANITYLEFELLKAFKYGVSQTESVTITKKTYSSLLFPRKKRDATSYNKIIRLRF